MPFHRYVALGDSFAEGVGDPAPHRANGLRGWADRVAAVLAPGRPSDFGYANLAIRGRKLDAVIAEQVEPAVALEPDLVTIYAGGNDIMRPKVDIDALVERYDAALGKLAGTGARLLVFTAFDPGGSAIYRPLRGRFALYNELVRWSADRHGATIVDFWRFRVLRDWRYWDHDRLHLGPAGHQFMAIQVLDVLGVPHGVDQPDLPPEAVLTRGDRYRANAEWTRSHSCPGSSDGSPAGRAATRSAQATGTRPFDSTDRSGPYRPPGAPAGGPADVAQLVERDLPKVDVASSSLVIRSTPHSILYRISQSTAARRSRRLRHGSPVFLPGPAQRPIDAPRPGRPRGQCDAV